jgi:hypothetical protein
VSKFVSEQCQKILWEISAVQKWGKRIGRPKTIIFPSVLRAKLAPHPFKPSPLALLALSHPHLPMPCPKHIRPLNKNTQAVLVNLCRYLDLNISGNKEELVDRINKSRKLSRDEAQSKDSKSTKGTGKKASSSSSSSSKPGPKRGSKTSKTSKASKDILNYEQWVCQMYGKKPVVVCHVYDPSCFRF